MSPRCRGVVFKAPYKVVVEDVPYPSIREPGEVILKVRYSGLCGSDLHTYRGHGGSETGYVMGHEAIGEVIEVGSGIQNFKIGDVVLAPFSLSCGDCYYCSTKHTSRCTSSLLIGSPITPGAQATHLRVPFADSSLMHLPEGVPPHLSLLMCDVLPTGYSAAMNAKRLAYEQVGTGEVKKGGVCVVIGCGPVGLCAISSALTLFDTVFAFDPSSIRRDLAIRHGANALPLDELKTAVLAATNGRGADAVLEIVGNQRAMTTAVDLVRPYGVVSSCGVHNADVSIPGDVLYGKNLRFQYGRCSVKAFQEPALAVLKANLPLFETFFEKMVPLDEAAKWYELFEKGEVAKTVFVMDA